MTEYKIVGYHPGYGHVTFTVSASDKASAFTKFKQIVGSPRQWNIKSNEAAPGSVNEDPVEDIIEL